MTDSQTSRSYAKTLKLCWVLFVMAGTVGVLGVCASSEMARAPFWGRVYTDPAIVILNVVAFYYGIRGRQIAIPVFGVVVTAMAMAFSEFMFSYANMNDPVAPPLWSLSDTISVIGALIISAVSLGFTFAWNFTPTRRWMDKIEAKNG